MNSTDCPNCKKDIGVWSIYKAGLPNMIKCPHCKSKLRYEPSGWKMVLISYAISIPIFAAIYFFVSNCLSLSKNGQIIAMVLLIFLAWTPFEIYFVRRLRSKHELLLKEN
ncbi:hypothetical protein KAH27_02720 [bacterium]|nr:hypothetical protein [bacterium]